MLVQEARHTTISRPSATPPVPTEQQGSRRLAAAAEGRCCHTQWHLRQAEQEQLESQTKLHVCIPPRGTFSNHAVSHCDWIRHGMQGMRTWPNRTICLASYTRRSSDRYQDMGSRACVPPTHMLTPCHGPVFHGMRSPAMAKLSFDSGTRDWLGNALSRSCAAHVPGSVCRI